MQDYDVFYHNDLLEGGWYWRRHIPGEAPDNVWYGPFTTRRVAKTAAIEFLWPRNPQPQHP